MSLENKGLNGVKVVTIHNLALYFYQCFYSCLLQPNSHLDKR